ncbi:MAG: hypothetical protein LQ343_004806 [Gyalolechia ehrenbergii]|nr:MAG: hypothetical protein LQ343_004806 [Gyalolechia ehrenbergii]
MADEKPSVSQTHKSSDEYDKGGYSGLTGTELGRQESVNVDRNVTARIQKPLAGIRRITLLQNVEESPNEVGQTNHIALIQKGVLVAQKPPALEQHEELDELERDALRNEVLHKWRQPWSLYFTVMLCSIGAAVQGWDQTGSNVLP